MPFIFCSMTWVTLSSTVLEDAPGYVALMVTAVGAIFGYCDMGRLTMDKMPASMMMMAMTQAKTGRSMKNLAIMRAPDPYCCCTVLCSAGCSDLWPGASFSVEVGQGSFLGGV